MASLTAHLLETGDHGRLGFHSDCPVCRRERLFGPLSSEPVVSRRAQAVLVGGVLALSSAAPATAVAQERDQQQEGVATPPQSGADGTDGVRGVGGAESPGAVQSPGTNESPVPGSPGGSGAPDGSGAPAATEGPGATDSPGFDPGGDTALPYEVAPPAAPEGAPPAVEDGGLEPEDRVLLDSEPADDPDARLVPLSEPEIEVPSTEPDLGVPPAETPLPPIAPDSPTSSPTLPEPETGAEAQEAPDRTGSDPRVEHGPDRASPNETARGAPRQQTAGTPVETVAGVVSGSSGALPAAVSDSRPASPDQVTAPAIDPAHRSQGRVHVVQPGESLWSIAKRVLGSEASPAQVAREVSRLWKLNENRIGTGNPDLLMVGTKLILR